MTTQELLEAINSLEPDAQKEFTKEFTSNLDLPDTDNPEDLKLMVKKLRSENEKRRKAEKELLERQEKELKDKEEKERLELEEKLKKEKNFEELLKNKDEQLSKFKAYESELTELRQFKENEFNKKLENVKDESAREILKKHNDIELIDLVLKGQVQAAKSPDKSDQRKPGEVTTLEGMDTDQIMKLATDQPDLYQKLMFKEMKK